MTHIQSYSDSCDICFEKYATDETDHGKILPSILFGNQPNVQYISDQNIFEFSKLEKSCRHVFCSFCIKKWFPIQNKCPICRKEFVDFYSSEDFSIVFDNTAKKTDLVFRQKIGDIRFDKIESIIFDLIEKEFETAVLIIFNNPTMHLSIRILKAVISDLNRTLMKSSFVVLKYKLLGKITKDLMLLPDTLDKMKLLSEVVIIYISLNRLCQAFQITMKISNHSINSKMLIEIVKKYISFNKLQKAKQVARVISDEFEKSYAFSEIAAAYVLAGNLYEAKRIAMHNPLEFYKSKILKKIAEASVASNKLSEAEQIAMINPDKIECSYELFKIAQAHILANNLSEAERLVMAIPNGWYRSHAFTEIADAYVLARQHPQAQRFIVEAKAAIGSIDNEWFKSNARERIAKSHFE